MRHTCAERALKLAEAIGSTAVANVARTIDSSQVIS
jgi:hypothetical protein